MTIEQLVNRNFEKEFKFSASRSSGPGGQNVNKVNTRVELRFNIESSLILSDSEKQIVLSYVSAYRSADNILITCQEYASQLSNKELAIKKFYSFLLAALKPKKKRKPTKPHRASIEKRISNKKKLSEIKKSRKKPNF